MIIVTICDKCKEMPLSENNYIEILRKPILWPKNLSHVLILEHSFMFVKYDYYSVGMHVKKSARISVLVYKNESVPNHTAHKETYLAE
jgi:hypothetical protein